MVRAKIALGRSVVAPLMLTLVAATGCTAGAQAHPQFVPAATPTPTLASAGVAGGACYLLEYDLVEQIVGTTFEVAASSATNDTFSCVLQTKSGSYPDLTVAVTPVAADAAVFRSTVPPKGSAAVTALGKAGYSVVVAASAEAGPGVEVGWLSGNGRLLVLRYRCPSGTTSADVGALTPKLVELARKVDQSSG